MTQVYILYIIGCIVPLFLYKQNRIAGKIGYGISAIASGYGVFYFFTHLSLTSSFAFSNSILYAPTFTLNPLGNFFSMVITLIAFAASIYSLQYTEEYAKKGSLAVMSSLYNGFILTMLMVLSSSDVFWFMVNWELMTILSAFLIYFNDSKESLKAVLIYLGVAHLGGVCITTAFLLLAHQSGSLAFSSFAGVHLSPLLASIIFLFAFVGFGSKAGMFPFHVWLPKAHPAAPSNVSALMSGVMIKVAIFGIIKFTLWLPIMQWWGVLIVIIGVLSALLGVLYALMQHDYKALLAYHSVENIGIILLGLGTGFYGLAIHSVTLAAIGFLAGLYHVLNHATFKGLLFLGAGSVLYRTHTKDMEILGGLAKKMPLTAFAFLIGAMAITALPPLNGFVSEWATYQAMIQGALGVGIGSRTLFVLSILALALTGALAVFCFVKVYTVIFGGTPRDMRIYNKAKEVPITMIVGMFILVTGCFVFGLGANIVVKYIMKIVSTFGGSYLFVQNGAIVSSPMGSAISTPLIGLILVSMLFLPFVIVAIFKNKNSTIARETDPWACGFKYDSRMQMTASPFTGNLKKLMEWLYRSKPIIKKQGYFKPVIYINHPKDIWWDIFYVPVIKTVEILSDKIACLQNGSTSIYSAYVFVALCIYIGISHIL